MKTSFFLLSLLLLTTIFPACSPEQNSPTPLISQPIHINREGLDFKGTENLLLVPENRNVADSRLIPIHYFRFEAKEKTDLPPVFYLPGGPGVHINERRFYEYYGGKRAKSFTFELSLLNQKRDVIVLNQRGNSSEPGLPIPNFKYSYTFGSKEKPMSFEEQNKSRKEGFVASLEKFKEMGVDTRGYDILHLVDDIEAVRQQIAAPQVALTGSSFGSQWALAYMQKYPKNVDRALLSGIEPLDHTYDDPQGVWDVFERIEKAAEANPKLKATLPEVGLTEALKVVIQRLEAAPQKVRLTVPSKKIDTEVLLSADDLRLNLFLPYAEDTKESFETWPKYITEMYEGDYRTLALWAYNYREGKETEELLELLVDNSLGISKEQEALFDSRPAAAWLGEVNYDFKATREHSPTPVVPPTFRQHKKHHIPVVMIHGDHDHVTPYSNATFLLPFLENGHLLTVENAGHSSKRALILNNPELASSVIRFMDADLREGGFEEATRGFPRSYALPELEFMPVEKEALFEQVLGML